MKKQYQTVQVCCLDTTALSLVAHQGLMGAVGHFRNEHYICDHPQCLEARFVVFSNEADLKKHRLTDHNDNMTRAERRAALNIPVNLTVRPPPPAHPTPPRLFCLVEGGVVIEVWCEESIMTSYLGRQRRHQASALQLLYLRLLAL